MKNIFYSLILIGCFPVVSLAQDVSVYPTNWWVGMKNPKLQLMLHAPAITNATIEIKYPGIKLVKVNKVESPNYLFLDLLINTTARPGIVKIILKGASEPQTLNFKLNERRKGKGTSFAQGVTSADFIYLLMPDRFSNGDPANDKIAGLKDQSLNRDSIYHRHGGDLQGVINNLDYLQNLGVTALWLTPVIQNDMPNRTEHGYAFTNHYNIEPRLGGDVAYKRLSDALHARGMKLIQDAVYNHVGLHHFTVQDPPMKDWLHQWPTFTQTSYKEQPLIDPYGAVADKKITVDGWFTRQMPDLNHHNPYLANYLIQHAIWSVEEFGVDGWRIDTYVYNDLNFMNRCNKALMDEYPSLSMFGETWVHGVPNQAYFTANTMNIPFKSNLPGVTDFQTNLYGIAPAMNQPFGWTEGVNKLYSTLAADFMYKDPMTNVNFLDNHDMTRFISQVGEDKEKLKSGLAWLLTCRGIPQMYYGTEVLMKGVSNPDGWVRLDFPGGWSGDKKNAFTRQGLTDDELEVLNYTSVLANYRKKSSAIKTGKMMQYVPQNGLYVYFRYDNKQTVMCIMNTDTKAREVDFEKYAERTNGFRMVKNVADNISFSIKDNISIPAKRMWVLELQK